jgi:hypothetical protein
MNHPEVITAERQDRVLKECEKYLKDSRRLRDIATLKTKGRTRSGRVNPLVASKESLRITKKQRQSEYPPTRGISITEIERSRKEGECLRCAWPSDRKGKHRVADCQRAIKLDKGTANFPKAKNFQELKVSAESDSDDEIGSES